MLRATSFTEFVTEESSYGGVFEPDRSDRVAGVVKDDLTISLNIGKGDLEAAMGACASRLKKLQSAFSRLVSMGTGEVCRLMKLGFFHFDAASNVGPIKARREARMVALLAAKAKALGAVFTADYKTPSGDAGVRDWRLFVQRVRLQRHKVQNDRGSITIRKETNTHQTLFKKHQLYSKYLPEFSQLTIEELEALGPIPDWEAPLSTW
eukprot:CAMPEP_0114247140 /NCGR_PEP_ID=MMETSP0058-20121206/12861_1 /TAXON_ID=36894 /ORGANISM="Pyramimonas parkeae, CCMP726" /LENGTH=207 /DNA_ID=CAMNT_0001360421 /DNA_START=491 /DNA_END=1111 /DNA_ORIENTATION=+